MPLLLRGVSVEDTVLLSVFVEKLTIPLNAGIKHGGPMDVPSPSVAGHVGLQDTSSSTGENGLREPICTGHIPLM